MVYIGSINIDRVYALRGSDGAVLWNYKAGNAVYSDSAVVNGTLYFGADAGYLYAFHLPN